MKWSATEAALVPLGVLTMTSTVPAAADGDKAVTSVAEPTVYDVAAVLPKLTAVAPVKPVPLMVTEVPPPSAPASGLTALTTGATA